MDIVVLPVAKQKALKCKSLGFCFFFSEESLLSRSLDVGRIKFYPYSSAWPAFGFRSILSSQAIHLKYIHKLGNHQKQLNFELCHFFRFGVVSLALGKKIQILSVCVNKFPLSKSFEIYTNMYTRWNHKRLVKFDFGLYHFSHSGDVLLDFLNILNFRFLLNSASFS